MIKNKIKINFYLSIFKRSLWTMKNIFNKSFDITWYKTCIYKTYVLFIYIRKFFFCKFSKFT